MIKYRYQKFSALILLLCFQIGFSQNRTLRKNYLPCESVRINCMVEDYQEMIWIGTENGLIQLDPIQNSLDCIPKIREGVSHIVVDKMDNKWLIGRQGTIFKMNKDNQIIEDWFINDFLTTYQKITSVFEANEKFWIGTSDGFIIHLNTIDGKIDTIETPTNHSIHSIYLDANNHLFIGTDQGMFYQKSPKKPWLSENQMFSSLKANFGNNIAFSKLAINHLDEIEGIYKITAIGNDLWIFGKNKNNGEFKLMSWTNDSWKHHSINCMPTFATNIKLDRNGDVWLNSPYEVVKYNLPNGKCTLIVSQEESSSMNMSNIVSDNYGRLWIGSLEKGLYRKELKSTLGSIPTSPKPGYKDPNISPAFAENNLIFLLDVSSSMRTRKKQSILEEAMINLIKKMNIHDAISIVAYSGDANAILLPTSVDDDNKKTIIDIIKDLPKPKGNTNMYGGVELAYKVVNSSSLKKGNNKIILISDGQDIPEKSIKKTKSLIRSPKNASTHLSILYFSDKENASITDKFKVINDSNASFKYVRDDRLKKVLLEEAKATKELLEETKTTKK